MTTFDAFLERACPPLGLEWRKFRRRVARRQVDARCRALGLADYAAYLRRLADDPVEAAGLADLMRVTVSRFFRNRPRWIVLAEHVLPALAAGRPRERALRAWSAGCCGGEEPYTLAIVWRGWIDGSPSRSIDILATDIDDAALARARQARYAPTSLREVPPALRRQWLTRQGAFETPCEAVRRLVRFERHNLMTDPAPREQDLVLCRYLAFTYYAEERRRQAALHLWRALRPGGALMIGATEQLASSEADLFTPWPHAVGVFRRRG